MHALPTPLVADQTNTIVSGVHSCFRWASRNPPCKSTTGSPFCQTENAAPKLLKVSKFSRNNGATRSYRLSPTDNIRRIWLDDLPRVQCFVRRDKARPSI